MKQAIVVRSDLGMGTGKLAAQVAHASLKAYDAASDEARSAWTDGGQKKIVLKGTSADQLEELADQARIDGVVHALVRDAGHTQLDPGTLTALAVGPAPEPDVDRVTGDLSLY